MTAVEFLHSEYIRIFGELNPSTAQLYEIAYALEQAKEMEKQNLKNLTKPLNHNKIKYLVISVIYVGFFAVIGLACYFTKSAIPLFGLILMPSFKSKSE